MKYIYILISLIFVTVIISCDSKAIQSSSYNFNKEDITMDVDKYMHINLQFNKEKFLIQTASLSLEEKDIHKFELVISTDKISNDSIGAFSLIQLKGINKEYQIEKLVSIKIYDKFPELMILNQKFINKSKDTLKVNSWKALNVNIKEPEDNLFWSFNGSSSEDRADWIQPVKKGFEKANYLGMNDSDYGGGIPVSALWRKDYGIAVGHTSLTPELISLPIIYEADNTFANLQVTKEFLDTESVAPKQELQLLETFISVYNGDCFKPLSTFSTYMKTKGLKFVPTEEAAFEPVWCAWGYERNFTVDEILKTLPKVKELGYKWVVIDDGFQIEEGNWNVNKKTFPGGDAQMKSLVNAIHSYGLKAKIWWTPLAIDMLSPKLKQHPEVLLRNPNESPQYITWWDAFYMSPNHPQTIKETKQAIDLFINKWGFDGFKMDGQHLNGIPPDYNPDIKDSEQAVRDLPKYFQMIYDQVRAVKKEAVIENCPCGTCMSFYNMATMNQAVSSDPESSWQIRTKGKVYKALIPETAYYGDHVELSDNTNDFATSFGVGAVLGSKFTWPKDNPTASESFLLTPEKEKIMKKWMDLYQEKMLSKGNYLGDLYDIGFDRPETHVIQKGKTLYYAFYAADFNGKFKLKGLKENRNYKVFDYFNKKEFNDVSKDNTEIEVAFTKFLLLEVSEK